jgi:hypothetical protein
VGWYFPLERKLAPRFRIKESEWTEDLGKWTQVMWNQVLHIIFIIPMIVNDVNLSVAFRGVSGLSS